MFEPYLSNGPPQHKRIRRPNKEPLHRTNFFKTLFCFTNFSKNYDSFQREKKGFKRVSKEFFFFSKCAQPLPDTGKLLVVSREAARQPLALGKSFTWLYYGGGRVGRARAFANERKRGLRITFFLFSLFHHFLTIRFVFLFRERCLEGSVESRWTRTAHNAMAGDKCGRSLFCSCRRQQRTPAFDFLPSFFI